MTPPAIHVAGATLARQAQVAFFTPMLILRPEMMSGR